MNYERELMKALVEVCRRARKEGYDTGFQDGLADADSKNYEQGYADGRDQHNRDLAHAGIDAMKEEVKKAEWLASENDYEFECSNCHNRIILSCGTPEDHNVNYCPKCGLKIGAKFDSQESENKG